MLSLKGDAWDAGDGIRTGWRKDKRNNLVVRTC